MSEGDRRRLRLLLEGFRSGMLVVRARDGALHGHPTVIARVDDNGDLYLATNVQGEHVRETNAEAQVALTLQFALACVTVSGPARLVSDRAVIGTTWNEGGLEWVPEGAEKSSLCLVKLRPVTAEYWDMRGMKKKLHTTEETVVACARRSTPPPMSVRMSYRAL
jgi:general stress protein 26